MDKNKVKVRIFDNGALPDIYEDTIERVLYWIDSCFGVEIHEDKETWTRILYDSETEHYTMINEREKRIVSEEELIDIILFLPTPIDTQSANIWIYFD